MSIHTTAAMFLSFSECSPDVSASQASSSSYPLCSNPPTQPMKSLSLHRTIPIAKRRYYGRVQQSVHEFLLLGPEIVKADFSQPMIQHFFDPQGTFRKHDRARNVVYVMHGLRRTVIYRSPKPEIISSLFFVLFSFC